MKGNQREGEKIFVCAVFVVAHCLCRFILLLFNLLRLFVTFSRIFLFLFLFFKQTVSECINRGKPGSTDKLLVNKHTHTDTHEFAIKWKRWSEAETNEAFISFFFLFFFFVIAKSVHFKIHVVHRQICKHQNRGKVDELLKALELTLNIDCRHIKWKRKNQKYFECEKYCNFNAEISVQQQLEQWWSVSLSLFTLLDAFHSAVCFACQNDQHLRKISFNMPLRIQNDIFTKQNSKCKNCLYFSLLFISLFGCIIFDLMGNSLVKYLSVWFESLL